jgi:glycine/D-amino acid oxidase-like deaminating enzyme
MRNFSPTYSQRQGLKPPELYEYFLDNFWFKPAGLDNEIINEPLRASHKADVVIIGGGYTGLSSAYNIHRRFPDKKIMLLEGACCGYGASGRNGGFCIATSLLDGASRDPEVRKRSADVSRYGIEQIKGCIAEHGLDCDFDESGMLDVAMNQRELKALEKQYRSLKEWGFDVEMLYGEALDKEIVSPRFIGGLVTAEGATLNPAKLARGMKKIVEGMGVEIRERSVVTRVVPGKIHHVDTELGEVRAPELVVATNAYSHKIGFFVNRLYPIYTYIVATEPLSEAQWEAIGWQNRQGLADSRMMFNYSVRSADGRIVMGGSDVKYYDDDGLAPGNNKSVTRAIVEDLIETFPPLEGIEIEHAWGGPMGISLHFAPSVGVMGEHGNLYYGVGFTEGVPSTQVGGRMIAELMAGEKNEFTTHYIVNRKIPYAGPRILRAAFGAAMKWFAVNFVKTFR